MTDYNYLVIINVGVVIKRVDFNLSVHDFLSRKKMRCCF